MNNGIVLIIEHLSSVRCGRPRTRSRTPINEYSSVKNSTILIQCARHLYQNRIIKTISCCKRNRVCGLCVIETAKTVSLNDLSAKIGRDRQKCLH